MNLSLSVATKRMVRYFLVMAVASVFTWFLIRDLNPSGALEVSYNLCTPSPYISEFSPHGRVLEIERKNNYCEQKIVIDPVYVDVRLPQQYDRAIMQLRYKKDEDVPLSFGVRTSLEGWQWDVNMVQTTSLNQQGHEDWERAAAEFDVSQMPLDHRRLRFMLSSPLLSTSGKEIVLREVHFRFEKPPFGREALKGWARSFLSR